jgi:hypothetical protein|tara:strand:- start:509 stop:745 length:237 start_codon:yes stop_codon:yes gene_type:complete
MAWNNRENSSQNPNDRKPVIDRCINCSNQEQVHTHITMEYEGRLQETNTLAGLDSNTFMMLMKMVIYYLVKKNNQLLD